VTDAHIAPSRAEAAAAAISHLSSMLTGVDAVQGGEGDQGGGAGNDDENNDDDSGDDDDAKEAATRAAVFGADSVDGHGGEEVPALWALFKQRQKEKNLRMTALTESIRESQVLVSAAEAMERTVPTEAALQDTGIGEEVEDIGERKRALLKEKEERAAADREREEARRKAREEAARAREEEARAQRALAEERRLAEEKEAVEMRMRADAARAKAEEDAAERLRILEEERKAEIVREEERRKAEEEEVRALEQAKAARAVLKKQEDEKERERARRSTDWHKSQVRKPPFSSRVSFPSQTSPFLTLFLPLFPPAFLLPHHHGLDPLHCPPSLGMHIWRACSCTHTQPRTTRRRECNRAMQQMVPFLV
jgi:hypothetical protein